MNLPNKLFFTGCPGSRWSGIAQDLENLDGVNISDHSLEREYKHGAFSGHKGAYFGDSMEFSSQIEAIPPESLESRLDQPWKSTNGMKILKSHDWAYKLPYIKEVCPNDWIMLIYRPDMASFAWWIKAGGFDITYPSYKAFKNYEHIHAEITQQNKLILEFGEKYDVTWRHYSNKWIEETFGQEVPPVRTFSDILVTVIK